MNEKIKTYQQRARQIFLDYYERLHDIHTLGVTVFVVLLVLLSWSGVKTIDTNYGLQKQITQLQQQNQLQQLSNANLRLQNEYYNTDGYLDISARQIFGLAAPGETVLTVPENVALAHAANLPDTVQAQTAQTKAKQPAYQRHFQAWMDFFLHRQNTGG